MSDTMIQVRNVPEHIHRRIKARAALEGVSMSHWILREIERAISRPSRQELLDRIAARAPVPDVNATAALREERDAR